MFPAIFHEFLKLPGERVMESFLSKVTREIFPFCNSFEIANTGIGMSQNVEILRSPLLTGVAR